MKTYNKKQLVISFLLYLIPLALIAATYNQLPAQIPSHWNINGDIDEWIEKFYLFYIIGGMILLHVVMLVIQKVMPDKHNVKNSKLFHLFSYYFMPVLTTIVVGATILSVYGGEKIVSSIVIIFIGVLFIVIGNYLPKLRHNFWLGIKLPWTLASTSNWEKTHRFAGPIWVVSGFIITIIGIFTIFLDSYLPFFIVTMVIVFFADILIPSIYSYQQYRKEYKD